ncbi:MAG: hypothetical protein A3E93_03065 [Candidatus Zambryskibacteria bacterium RIFCSPHIGHO2_12_FULL_43_12b]|nr:MAG: hypothetical protein A3E93_03065 [Candidatus Zambryskibacteria bacterium RIFCSPHIGHO2_12_FULL_43_12b]
MIVLSFLAGFIPGLIIISPVEWLVHKHMLHVPHDKRKWFNRASAHAHNDVHHAAFRGPAHYYRDIVNENVVIHFHWTHVVLILSIAIGYALALNRLYSFLVVSEMSFGWTDFSFILGIFLASLIGYMGYEINHHYMHVIGERRLTINRVLGDLMQGGKERRDGNLRFSKPLLDTVCNAIEEIVDHNARLNQQVTILFDTELIERLHEQAKYNSDTLKLSVATANIENVLHEATQILIKREKSVRESLSRTQRIGYAIDRKVQKLFRGSNFFLGKYFRHIDNNHFMHHHKNNINLNVFLTWADIVFGTRRDSSAKALEAGKFYWLCPNSPDTKPFSLN